MTTKVAVIGIGYWGKKHVEEYARLGCAVYGVDLNERTLTECAEKFGLTPISMDAFLADSTIQHVSICVPNDYHFSVAEKCLRAGKNVLVEKPLVLETNQGELLKHLAQQKKCVLNVGHIFRFNNAINYARDLLLCGQLGVVHAVLLTWNNLEAIKPDRDIVFDLAPHPFDILHYFFGKNPDKLSCFGQAFRTPEKEEMALIVGRLGDALVQIEMSWITPKKERSVVIVGSKKTAFVDALLQKVTVWDNASQTSALAPVVANNTLGDELSFFLQCKPEAHKADVDTGIAVVRMLEESFASMKKNARKL